MFQFTRPQFPPRPLKPKTRSEWTVRSIVGVRGLVFESVCPFRSVVRIISIWNRIEMELRKDYLNDQSAQNRLSA